MKRVTIPSTWIILIIMCGLALPGCQTGVSTRETEKSGGTPFGAVWTAYRACRTSADLQVASLHADSLRKLVPPPTATKVGRMTESKSFELTSLFKANEPRLSAEPQLMALDCWLHAGHLAASTGQHDLAYTFYSDVLRSPRTPATHYYLGIAQARLMILSGSLHASHVSSSSYPPN